MKNDSAVQHRNLLESVLYPNGGLTHYYVSGDVCFVVDKNVWQCQGKKDSYPYSLITDRQNTYMQRYRRLYRFLEEDVEEDTFERILSDDELYGENFDLNTVDRSTGIDSSPLEFLFEERFCDVYGAEAVKYLEKEYPVSDGKGHTFFIDYLVHTKYGNIAVEENGINYHHPQVIGKERYRQMLIKQNLITQWGIKLFRFSTEDCQFENRINDDIRNFFGRDTSNFIPVGIKATRQVKLYDHQELTLERIQRQRAENVHTFLVHYPTGTGKSMIVEQDMAQYLPQHEGSKALVLAPTGAITKDWEDRIRSDFPTLSERVVIKTYAAMARHYAEYGKNEYAYIVVDEAHHAVAPVLRRVIEHFTPDFLIGLTATDERLDHKKLETVFGTYETDLSLREAMEKGILAEAHVYRIETNLDLSHVRFNGKDYYNTDLEKGIRVSSRNELIADVLKKYFSEEEVGELQGVVFCINRNHAEEMSSILREAGFTAEAYTSKTKDPEKLMKDFKNHKIRFLCSCQMISEGWDYPELGILVMARPTMSKVLYLQQLGRGLRRTETKNYAFVIDVVDQYGASLAPCSMHTIFHNPCYVPFGNILKRNYLPGDVIRVDGIVERVERIVPVNTETFEDTYRNFLNQEQLAREYFLSTGSIITWVKKKKIQPDFTFSFGSRRIYLFSPDNVEHIREENHIPIHDDNTIKEDFFSFLEERDYSLSYKMPFLLSMLKEMNPNGEADIDKVLNDYIEFYQGRIDRGLTVDRSTCPYDERTLKDKKFIKRNMLTNPFEKFERKRFMYYSKNLNMIAMNHALYSQLTNADVDKIRMQMQEDLKNYYSEMGGI